MEQKRTSPSDVIYEAALRTLFKPAETASGQKKEIIPEGDIDLLLDPVIIQTFFIRAFTHITYSYENNYEEMEKLGDLLANYFVGITVRQKYRDMDQEGISNMISHYKGNQVFSECIKASIPNIDVLIRRKGIEITDKIRADVFEALIYAVVGAYEKIKPGIGLPIGTCCAMNLFNLMMRSQQYEEIYARPHPKTIVDSMFPRDKGGKRSVNEYPNKEERYRQTLEVVVNPEKIRALADEIKESSYMKNRQNATLSAKEISKKISENAREIGTVKVKNAIRKDAVTDAYNTIISNLERYGLTYNDYNEMVRNRYISTYKYADRVHELEKSRKEKVYIKKKPNDEDGYDWLLYTVADGTNERNVRFVGTSGKSSVTFHEAAESLLDEYIGNKEETAVKK